MKMLRGNMKQPLDKMCVDCKYERFKTAERIEELIATSILNTNY